MEAIEPIETRHELQTAHATPDQLLTLAINRDLDIDKLAKLMELQDRYNKDLARKAFFAALSEFQIQCPEIRKSKEVNFGNTKYSYAPLADIDRQIKKSLKDHGLSKRWEIDDQGEEIIVTCFITHTDGHTEKTHMRSKADTSGSKNPIQARGSAIEYMKRYTLIGALGLTTADADIDGRLPEIDMDILHQQYMRHYNHLIQIDSKYTSWHPDNFKTERTPKLFIKAIAAIREKLGEVTPKKA